MKGQLTFAALGADAGFERYSKSTRRTAFLAEMDAIVPWAKLVALIEPHYSKAGNGRPPIPLERMLPPEPRTSPIAAIGIGAASSSAPFQTQQREKRQLGRDCLSPKWRVDRPHHRALRWIALMSVSTRLRLQ